MKSSRYNYIFSEGNSSYWFNGIEQTFFKLPVQIGEKIEQMLHSPDEIEQVNFSFYRKLIDSGFLVEDNIDEVEIIRKRNEEAINRQDYFLIILPTLNCNFRCWYCIQEHVASKMSISTIEKIKRHIDYMIDVKKISSLHLEWFGGEPFMYLNEVIAPIAQYALQKCHEKGVFFYHSATTNGYFLHPENINKLSSLKFRNFHITLDGTQKVHDSVKFQRGCYSAFERTLKNIDYILKNITDAEILLRINYTNDNLDEVIVDQVNSIISFENRYRITINPKKVWQAQADEFTVDNITVLLDRFKNSGYKVVYLDIISNYLSCYSDKKFYNTINFNGNVVKCTACDDLYAKEAPGVLNEDGTISWKNGFEEKFFKKRYENEMCLSCKYLPICMGVCARNYEDDSYFYCKHSDPSVDIRKSIINYINYSL